MIHQMDDKLHDLKGDAIEDRKERKKMGYNAHYRKLDKYTYVVFNECAQTNQAEVKQK